MELEIDDTVFDVTIEKSVSQRSIPDIQVDEFLATRVRKSQDFLYQAQRKSSQPALRIPMQALRTYTNRRYGVAQGSSYEIRSTKYEFWDNYFLGIPRGTIP